MFDASPVTTIVYLTIAAAAFVAGSITWCRKLPLGAATYVGTVGTAIAITVLAALSGVSLYAWYFVPILPFVVAVAAIGVRSLLLLVTRHLRGASRLRENLVSSVACALLVALFAIVVAPQLQAQNSRSLEPRRESVAATRGNLAIDDPEQLRTITAHCNHHTLAYDPHGFIITGAAAQPEDTKPGLVQLMRLADTTGATLWVNVGSADSLGWKFPDVAQVLSTPELFELVHRLHGTEPQYERHIYRYKGGMFDFLKGL